MRFKRSEIKSARSLREQGFVWKPAIGDWYVTDDGFTTIVTGNGDGELASSRHTWLPLWGDCRAWLRERGYTHPEIVRDEEGAVRLDLHSPSGALLSGEGETDLECFYALVAMVLSA